MGSVTALAARLARPALALAAAASVAFAAPTQAAAQRSVPIVRDAEIEALVRDYAQPILEAAGLGRSNIQIVLVSDNSFNAFVAGRRVFINTGALLTAETPNEIIGVLAHEIGHIAGGHQQRLREQLAHAQTMAVVAALAGLGAAAAGVATGTQGLLQGGTGLAMGGAEIARRNLLSYQRTEEIAADRSALTYLERTGQSARGMLRTFERMANALSFSGARIDPYQISHPMPRERIATLETLARESRFFDRTDPPALQQRHDLMRAKIAAYTQGAQATQRIFRNDPRGLPALYGDAIATFLHGDIRTALGKIDALVRAHPNNAYFHEMRGEMLMKANRPADAAEAIATAIRLDQSRSGLLRVARGRALVNTGRADLLPRAIEEIRTGLDRTPEFAAGYRILAQAHGQRGEIAEAELATAEGHFHSANYRDAKIFAARAQQKMRAGSPGFLRAQDIINFRPPR